MIDFFLALFFFQLHLSLPSMISLDQVHVSFRFLCLFCWFLFFCSTVSSPQCPVSFTLLAWMSFIALRVWLPATGYRLLDPCLLLSLNLLISNPAHPPTCWTAPHGHPCVFSNENTPNETYWLPCSSLLIFPYSLFLSCYYHLGAKNVSCHGNPFFPSTPNMSRRPGSSSFDSISSPVYIHLSINISTCIPPISFDYDPCYALHSFHF